MSGRRRQLCFVIRTHGGARRGAGRKPAGPRAGVSHRARSALAARHPVHVTLRMAAGVPSLRTGRSYAAIRGALGASLRAPSAAATGLRVVHYAVMSNHMHLLVEAADRMALSRGMQGLSIRLARAINRARGGSGRVLGHRYHARALRTPLEVRRALAYVLGNARRHGIGPRRSGARWLDPCSSARTFDGWQGGVVPSAGSACGAADVPVAPARSWLLRVGWRRHGLLPASGPG